MVTVKALPARANGHHDTRYDQQHASPPILAFGAMARLARHVAALLLFFLRTILGLFFFAPHTLSFCCRFLYLEAFIPPAFMLLVRRWP